jgi:thioredoxin-like negative regulator of GroEL
MTATKPLTAAAHDAALSDGIAVLVFLMDQSPASQAFRPVLEQVAAEQADIPCYVVDPGQESELAELHHLRALPTCIFYRDGSPIRRTAGGLGAEELTALLDEVRQADMHAELNDLLLEMAMTEEVLSPLLPRRSAPQAEPASGGRPTG